MNKTVGIAAGVLVVLAMALPTGSAARDRARGGSPPGDGAARSRPAAASAQAEPNTAPAKLLTPSIVDLLGSKRIEVETIGEDIWSVQVKVRRRIPQTVTVRVPAGTYFASQNPSAQNMVATAETVQTLDTDEWAYISVPAACASCPKGIPDSNDRFQIMARAPVPELQQLAPVLAGEAPDRLVRQAAVWIVTDNASYEDLGTLVSRPFGLPFGGSRLIEETEAAQGMRLCEKAGINVAGKAIWRDCQTILKALQDEDLRQWLQRRIEEERKKRAFEIVRTYRRAGAPPRVRVRMRSEFASGLSADSLSDVAVTLSDEWTYMVLFYLPGMNTEAEPWAVSTVGMSPSGKYAQTRFGNSSRRRR